MNRADSDYRPPGPLRCFAIPGTSTAPSHSHYHFMYVWWLWYDMPDFTHWSWPEPSVGAYDDRVKKIREASKQPWDERINKIYFRGALSAMRQFVADAASESISHHNTLLINARFTYWCMIS
jgi:hypothetical protein